MKPILKLKNNRSAVRDSANRGSIHVRVLQRALTLLLITVVSFSGCKKTLTRQSTGETQTPVAPQLKENFTPGPDFTIAVIPDTQVYVETGHNNTPGTHWLDYFTAQTQWIADHKTSENIAYTVHVGDIVNDGDLYVTPWLRADTAMKILDAANVPYGTACGNHEQTPNGIPFSGATNDGSTTVKYNQYFGVSRVSGKSWYGGTYLANNNDSHYDFFTAGGLNFIVIFMEFDDSLMDNVNMGNWCTSLLTTYASKKAIIVTHHVGGPTTPSTFGPQCADIYSRVKSHSNVFMFIGGHVNGEGYRQDTYSGRTIKSFISDYQFRTNGGDGYMRLYKISVINDLISVKTYSPYRENHSQTPFYETDSDSQYTKTLFHEETATRKCDFNQDGKTELAFFNAGVWKVNGMANVTYGTTGDLPVPMDYDGDGETDLCVFRPSEGKWYSQKSPDHSFGISGDIPVPGDYTGDGIAEFAVYRPSTFNWYIYPSTTAINYGAAGDIPVPGDYNGDGKVDIALWRPSTFHWYIMGQTGVDWGAAGDIPVPGDYNGDGQNDFAIFRPSTGKWYLKDIVTSFAITTPATGDIPAPGDYDGTGKTQPAVYRPSTHTLYIYHWDTSTTTTVNYASSASGDKLLNLPYCIRKFFFP